MPDYTHMATGDTRHPTRQYTMIVFVGDWVKAKEWKQVVDVNAGNETFATLNIDGELIWWDTEEREYFSDHKSNPEMQALLRDVGI